MDNIWFASALWIGLALIAASMQAWVAVSVALLEIIIGAVAGNLIDLKLTPWVNYLAGFWGDPADLPGGRRNRRERHSPEFRIDNGNRSSRLLCALSGCPRLRAFRSGWPWPQARIAGIALSTTSVAVVYAVMVETGFNNTEIGKIILVACFINDIGTVLALGLVFAN